MCSRLDLETPGRKKAQQEFRDVERLTRPKSRGVTGQGSKGTLSLCTTLIHVSGLVMCPLSLSLQGIHTLHYQSKISIPRSSLSLSLGTLSHLTTLVELTG